MLVHTSYVWQILDLINFTLLIYLALYIPVRLSVLDTPSNTAIAFDFIIDLFFMLEIILTFFTVIKVREGTLITDKKTIAQAYLNKGFILDIFLAFPT